MKEMGFDNLKFIVRIDTRLKEMGIAKGKFYDDLCLANNSTTTWKRSVPSADIAYRIAQYLDVSMEWLLTGEERHDEIPADLLKFRDLSPANKNAVLALINALYEQESIAFVKKNAPS